MAQRIVVVEDTSELLMLFGEILREEGYQVALFSSPLLAVEKISAASPHLIILDYLFGREAGGWHILQALKLNRETAGVPVIMCTGASRLTQELDGYVATGAVALLPKPFSVDALLTVVEQMLAGARHKGVHQPTE